MWEMIKGFFSSIFGSFNGFLERTFQFDQLILGLYDQFVEPLPELFKILGAVFLAIIIVFGTISFVKKLLKLFIVLAVILAIVVLVTQLNS
ncbi:MAG: hypothetical protein CVV61_03750 [Tenericutes bacterium HGW-Tenericutes-6]|jgi:phage-related minor tail protein|nr:MAG: hypothetical protein CVV61_03750 [Tenericutes bacterium HGW-Tenericutes-6]